MHACVQNEGPDVFQGCLEDGVGCGFTCEHLLIYRPSSSSEMKLDQDPTAITPGQGLLTFLTVVSHWHTQPCLQGRRAVGKGCPAPF